MNRLKSFKLVLGAALLALCAGRAFAASTDSVKLAADPGNGGKVFDGSGPGAGSPVVAVDASTGAAKPKWDTGNKTNFDQAARDLGRETGIDKVEARADSEAPPKKDDGKGWSWGGAAKGALTGALVGGGLGWLLGSVGILGALGGGWGLLLGAGIGLLAAGVFGGLKNILGGDS